MFILLPSVILLLAGSYILIIQTRERMSKNVTSPKALLPVVENKHRLSTKEIQSLMTASENMHEVTMEIVEPYQSMASNLGDKNYEEIKEVEFSFKDSNFLNEKVHVGQTTKKMVEVPLF